MSPKAAALASGWSWTAYTSDAAERRAEPCAHGCYQRDLLSGDEAWSGSTLQGKARHYGASYAKSRSHLQARLRAAGLVIRTYRVRNGRLHDGGRAVIVISER